jgi:D-serine dehydratase
MYHIFDAQSGNLSMPQTFLQLGSALEHKFDAATKGFPKASAALRLGDIAHQHWNMLQGDLSLPVAVVRDSALQHNIAWMRHYAESRSIRICPHGKTTMCPQLFEMQLQAGAWGITAATTSHLEVYLQHGVRRVIYANQLVAEADIDFVISRLQNYPELDFYCLADSIEIVARLAQRVAAKGLDRPLQLLLEIGIPGGRCGVRNQQQALEVARAIKVASPQLALRGIEAFEGIVDLTSQAGKHKVREQLELVLSAASSCEHEQLFAPGDILLTAGGSACFDGVAAALLAHQLAGSVEVIIRSGCYVVHDHGFYAQLTADFNSALADEPALAAGLRGALEVWAQVQSVPEPGLAIVAMGKRDAGSDIALPQLQWYFRPGRDAVPQTPSSGCQTLAMNDQHLYLRFPEHLPLAVGDLLGFGISHPCTTFDKWHLLYCIDDNYTVLSALKTYF